MKTGFADAAVTHGKMATIEGIEKWARVGEGNPPRASEARRGQVIVQSC